MCITDQTKSESLQRKFNDDLTLSISHTNYLLNHTNSQLINANYQSINANHSGIETEEPLHKSN